MSSIRWSPVTAMWLNKPPGTVIVGGPGSGKTFTILNIAANELAMGRRIIAIDPKDDLANLRNLYPRLKVVDVNDIMPDALNPYTFLENHKPDGTIESVDSVTIMAILELLCGSDERTKQDLNSIGAIIRDSIRDSKMKYKNLNDLWFDLKSSPREEARRVADKLQLYKDSQYGELLFNTQEHAEPLVLSSTESMVISLLGMELPSHDKDVKDFSMKERFSATIVFILTTKLRDILKAGNRTPTTLICDEAHVLFSNDAMNEVISEFLRLGRSLNVATVLASQGTSHFPKEVANNISTKFIFRSSVDETTLFLKRYDTSQYDSSSSLDVDSIISAVTNFPQGQCFMMDCLGRNGIIRITSIYDSNLLTTNPLEKKK